mgnify:CR=1 FL=1
MTNFWCEDYIYGMQGCSPPEASCVKDDFTFTLDLKPENIYVEYRRETIEKLSRCYKDSKLPKSYDYKTLSEIQGIMDWEVMKFYGILPDYIYHSAGENTEESNYYTDTQRFGEYYPEQILIHVCINTPPVDDVLGFDESIVDSREFYGQHFICTSINNP